MAKYVENKILTKKKLDQNSTVKVTQNKMSGRIFVEFATEDAKIVLQKSFQDTYDGRKEADVFSKSIKSTDELKQYFGMKK